MEQISFRLHAQSVLTWRKLTSPKRRALEYVLLLCALACFGTVFCLHGLYSSDMFDFGTMARNCLSLELENRGINVSKLSQVHDDYFPMIRILVSDESMLSEEMLAHKEELYEYFDVWRSERDFVGGDGFFSPSSSTSTQSIPQSQSSYWDMFIYNTIWKEKVLDGNSTICTGVCSFFESPALEEFLSRQRVYLFSFEKGTLFLPPERREKLNIPVIDVKISKDDECLGPRKASWLLDNVLGYDMVTVQWCLNSLGHRGHLYNVFTKQLMDLSTALPQPKDSTIDKLFFKVNAVSCTIFLFFCMSTLVSFTLRETQERMLRFTYLLQHHIRHELPIFAIVFTHVTESLLFVPVMVGLHFFMRQFFLDQMLSFIVISLVWCAEVFSVVSLRTAIAANFFPRVFAIYLSFFLLYFFHFPRGHTLLALFTTILFTFHAMLYCMNTLEIPAFDTGLISETVPRESLMGRNGEMLSGSGDASSSGSHSNRGASPNSPTILSRNEATRTALPSAAEIVISENGGMPLSGQLDRESALERVSAEPHPSQMAPLRKHHNTPEHERRRRAANELLALRTDTTLSAKQKAKRVLPLSFPTVGPGESQSVRGKGAEPGTSLSISTAPDDMKQSSSSSSSSSSCRSPPPRSQDRTSPRSGLSAWFLGSSSDSEYCGTSRSPSKDPSDPDTYFW